MCKNGFWLMLGGVVAGAINGILGGGAGVVVVLLLLTVCHLDQQQAQATALLVVLPMSILSSILYIVNGQLPVTATVIVCIACTVGGLIGALLLGKVNSRWCKLIFAIILIAGGVRMIVGGLI